MARKKKAKAKRTHDVSYEGLDYDYSDGGEFGGGWPAYRSVGDRKIEAANLVAKLRQKGEVLSPVIATERKLAKTFWGQAWCRNLEAHHDYESRLPRGRSYLRNGSVIDLQISTGLIEARVSGSRLYEVEIKLKRLEQGRWQDTVAACAGSIGSVLELLAGNISSEVMAIMTSDGSGIFPSPAEITMSCSCPDFASMCKHVAATLYGVGVRLDDSPHLFFTLRGVDHTELIASSSRELANQLEGENEGLDSQALGSLFGIDIAD